jgi:hypothetical protein
MTKGYNDMNMLETFLSKVVEINVLNLKPGQILVFKIDIPALSKDTKDNIYRDLRVLLKKAGMDNEVMIISNQVSLSVIDPVEEVVS